MGERQSELRRRRSRAKKMAKLKSRLAKAKTNNDKDQALKKIHRISPWWKAPATAS